VGISPEKGAIMTEHATMSVFNEFFQRAKPCTPNALQLKRAWELWYNRLDWYEKNVGSPHTLRDARARMTAFKVMNAEPRFGEEAPHQTIRLGSTGPSVIEWQKVLGISPSGIFDAATKEATKNYQLGKGLTSDGVVGPATWGTVPVKIGPAATVLRTRLVQSGPLVAIGSALVAGGLLAATLSPVRK
jgi:hypothetical protein